jgi:hypothetical protein
MSEVVQAAECLIEGLNDRVPAARRGRPRPHAQRRSHARRQRRIGPSSPIVNCVVTLRGSASGGGHCGTTNT